MQRANLVVGANGIRLIDVHDCGHGWLKDDFAAAIGVGGDDPRIPEGKSAWLQGHQSARPMSRADIDEIGAFVLLRRMALLA